MLSIGAAGRRMTLPCPFVPLDDVPLVCPSLRVTGVACGQHRSQSGRWPGLRASDVRLRDVRLRGQSREVRKPTLYPLSYEGGDAFTQVRGYFRRRARPCPCPWRVQWSSDMRFPEPCVTRPLRSRRCWSARCAVERLRRDACREMRSVALTDVSNGSRNRASRWAGGIWRPTAPGTGHDHGVSTW